MPPSKPPHLGKGVKPTTTPKKNTVDYIPSKISYDTAIPVSIFDDRREFLERCKPYDIIDGPNPLDDVQDDAEPHASTTGTEASEVVKLEKSSTLSSRKRSRSPLKGTGAKNHAMKEEAEVADTEGAPAAPPAFTRPSRAGWAAEQLREGRPYQLLRSRDMEMRVRYVLDDGDYAWCAAQGLAPEVVQRGITYLEWAYVSFLLTAATPHVDDPEAGVMAPLSSTEATGAAVDLRESVSAFAVGNGNGVQRDGEELTVSSPTTNAIARLNRARRQRDRDRASAGGSTSALTCALCSKSVHLLTPQSTVTHSAIGAEGTSSMFERASRSGVGAGRGRAGRSKGDALATALLSLRSRSDSSTPRSAAYGSGRSFPSHDLQHQGLRCCECGVVAHLRCWFLSAPPRLPDAWTCDGCTNYAQHRKRSAGVCCMCGRMGGVRLRYVSSSAAKEDAEGGHSSSGDPQSPMQTHVSGGFSGAAVVLSDMVCHAVCALTMSELAIQHRPTIFRRNGLVDMEERPYVYALRRVGKQRYAMHCVFCEHGGTGRCVQCHHPHCFEAMHASCAAEAHTVDCHTDTASSPSSAPLGGGRGKGTLDSTDVACASAATACWSSCSTYCRKHYGYPVSNSIGSAALGDKAEAEALALDLTGLLTGEDGVTSPVVRKRGRGRPPVALVQQREAERDLIQRLHVYWLQRREQRRRTSGQLVGEVNARLRPVVAAMLRPEIVKVSADKVRLAHFLSLVPEWQWQLVSIVEGELPLPDEEYDDVQKYRKAAHTRRSGNTRSLYDRMSVAATQLDLMCRITATMKHECRLRRTSAELEVDALRTLCGWK